MNHEISSPQKKPEETFDGISNPQVNLKVQLESTQMKLNDLMTINAGDLLLLDQAVEREIGLVQGNKVIAYGGLVTVDGRYAMRITRVIGS